MKEGVQWSFNPPTASHHGRFWERLIIMVRHVLCSVLKQQTLNDEGLHTVFCKVEAILNSRPITKSFQGRIYTTEDAGDRFSIWLSCFGRDGFWNTSLFYKNDKNGQEQEEISSQGTSS